MMKCQQYKQFIEKLRTGVITDQEQDSLQSHIATCSKCRKEYNDFEKIQYALKKSYCTETAAVEARDSILSKLSTPQTQQLQQRKKTMLKRLIPATAAVALLLIALAISGIFKSATTAYALEQTLEANQTIRSLHFCFENIEDNTQEEHWIEFDKNGSPTRARVRQPNSLDGPKDFVWQEGLAKVWLQDKELVVIIKHEEMLNKMKEPINHHNPITIVEELYQMQASGKAEIGIEEPLAPDGPTILSVIINEEPDVKGLYEVDSETKFVQKFEQYNLIDGQYKLRYRVTYLDYNQPIDPAIFTLDVPEDVTELDWTVPEIGLAQGDLSDEEIAIKVTREFHEALIDKDYDKAGQLLSGLSAERLKEMIGDTIFIRLISVGTPERIENTEPQSYRVPVEVEIELDGETLTDTGNIGARPVHGQPDRWCVYGTDI